MFSRMTLLLFYILINLIPSIFSINKTFLTSPSLLDGANSFARLDNLGAQSQCFKTQTQLICPGDSLKSSQQSSTGQQFGRKMFVFYTQQAEKA